MKRSSLQLISLLTALMAAVIVMSVVVQAAPVTPP
jgi:hypothetical protein